MIQAEKVAVSLPKELVHRAEEARDQLGFNRSQFYQIALKTYLEEFPGEEDRKLAQIYQDIRQTDQKLLHGFRGHSYKHLPLY